MHTKSKKRKYIEPERFYIARKRAGLTVMKSADLLDVDARTIRNWENGSTRIPFSAFRLMRMEGGYSLQGKDWEDWAVWDGKLYSPTGRSFEPHELLYVSHYISMARLFIKTKADARAGAVALHRAAAFNPVHESDSREKASAATAAAGVSPSHDSSVVWIDFSQQNKTPERRKSQGELMFGRFSSYRRAAANEAHYG